MIGVAHQRTYFLKSTHSSGQAISHAGLISSQPQGRTEVILKLIEFEAGGVQQDYLTGKNQ
jgi:hypothetical protein